ncbi:MAG: alkaline phosphatase family protein [Acidimicrobiales bacterium]
MSELTRRGFLGGAAGALGLGALGSLSLSGCGSNDSASSTATTAPRTPGTTALPDPSKAPFDTVVVLMMENRSFDTLLGWVPGANGKQAGLSYVDSTGQSHETWRVAPNWQGCQFQDPFHTVPAVNTQFNDGKIDGFLKLQPVGDLFPIGYYLAEDLPVLASLAQSYTLFDSYFCSLLGPTWPNRFYQLSATTDVYETGIFPTGDQPRPCNLDLAIFDRTKEAGLSSLYYSPGEPMTELYASKKYDSLTVPYEQFLSDAKDGKLPNVAFVDPDYTAEAEWTGTSNDMHPYGSVKEGDAFLAEVYNAIRTSPQWDRTVLVINYDEHGGFYDTVVPPTCIDDTKAIGPGAPTFTNLGFRVPAIAISPFAPKKIEKAGPYEHCSVLKMIEWRWGLQPMTARDANAKNFAEALDFTTRRDPIELPQFTTPQPEICVNPKHLP